MPYKDASYISTHDLLFEGVLHDVKKNRTAFQPIFEAVTNAFEAIRIKEKLVNGFKGKILIEIKTVETTTENPEFQSLSVTDDGIGFNEEEFKRFNTYKDFTKGFKNLGCGRLQFTHFFDNTIINSTFNEDGKYFEREFIVSKNDSFLKNNAIVFQNYCKEVPSKNTGTTITFNTLLEHSPMYDSMTHESLKDTILERYMHYLCHNKANLPALDIVYYVQSKIKGSSTISSKDIPNVDKTETIKLPYSRISSDGKSIQKSEKTQDFIIDSFRISQEHLKVNKLNLVSKGEIIEKSAITLNNLAEGDHIKGFKFLFLVASEYIDLSDTNMRGELLIPTRESFSKNINLFTPEEIILEDIQEGVDNTIDRMYPDIKAVKQEHSAHLESLKKMFLLSEETAKEVNISINDSERKILEKFYEAEAKKIASIDANIKSAFDSLNSLDTTTQSYSDDLQKEVDELVKVIPLQNKISLTQYVARRKLVLELFDKILSKQLSAQQNGNRNIDEKLLHNLIFQQSTSNPEESDLWLINEDFIYFKGTSEKQLKDVNIAGKPLLKKELNAEEKKVRESLNEDRFAKRPDILLFPEENKCIIIEFKNPEVNVSEHLTQITNYASLIWNFANKEFIFNTFYGYLIGEGIEPTDVRLHDGDFIEAFNFNYLFRPHKKIFGAFGKADASLYTEVIKYSTLLERAKKRNQIFIDKLNAK